MVFVHVLYICTTILIVIIILKVLEVLGKADHLRSPYFKLQNEYDQFIAKIYKNNITQTIINFFLINNN